MTFAGRKYYAQVVPHERNFSFSAMYIFQKISTRLKKSGRCSGLMVSLLDSGASFWIQAPAGDILLCSWLRHFTLMVPLSTQVYTRLLPNKYFKEPRWAKSKKSGAQHVMFWELLQNFRHPKDFLGCPRLLGSC